MSDAIFKTQPWSHQRDAFHFAVDRPATMLAMDMGTGKSKVVCDLIVNWGCKTVLILCPKSVIGVWLRELRLHTDMPDSSVLRLAKGAVSKKMQIARLFFNYSGTKIVVINYESAKAVAFRDWSLSKSWDLVVCDESHRIKTHNSQVGKYCYKLADRAERRLCLTGTPMPHSPLDVFGQFRFLKVGLFGSSWWRFKNHYSVSGNPSIPQQITGYKNQPELQKRFRMITYRCEADDVLDLPEVQHNERTFDLCPKAEWAYRELENELITEVEEDRTTTVANALVKLLRLQQITSGYIVEDETGVETEIDKGKIELLTDLIEDFGPSEPCVVFCRFRHDLKQIEAVAAKLKRRYGEISGRRKDLTSEACYPPDIDVMGVQINSGGVGIDLTRARYAVYWSIGFSLGDYEQSLARLHRPGQERPMSYYHLIANGTVDVRVYQALRQRKDVVSVILDGLKGEV